MASCARLARVTIVSEIPEGESLIPDGPGFRDAEKFWEADSRAKTQVLNAIADTGAKAVVAAIPNSASTAGWQRIGTTDLYVHLLK